jgi:RimJ/RimL family protein N-acetyltransferase
VNAEIRLRPVSEEDLALLYRLFSDPAATSEYEWHGWLDPQWLRRQWEENRMLGEDGGKLMVALGDDTLGLSRGASDRRGSARFAGISASLSRRMRAGMVMALPRSGCSRTTCSRTPR